MQYFKRPAPFVSFISEARLGPDEEEYLRSEAVRCQLLEAQLDEMRELLLEFQHRVEGKHAAKKLKSVKQWGKARLAMKMTQAMGSPEPSPAVDGEDNNEEEDEDDANTNMQQILRSNINLRLQIAARNAADLLLDKGKGSGGNSNRRVTKSRLARAVSSLKSMTANEGGLGALKHNVDTLALVTESNHHHHHHHDNDSDNEAQSSGNSGPEAPVVKSLAEIEDQLKWGGAVEGNVASKTIHQALSHIHSLSSQLATAEARVAIASLTGEEGGSGKQGLGKQGKLRLSVNGALGNAHLAGHRLSMIKGAKSDTSDEEDEENEVEDLQATIKELLAEREALKAQATTLAEAASSFSDTLKAATPENPLKDGIEKVKQFYRSNQQRLVIVPWVVRAKTAPPIEDDALTKSKKSTASLGQANDDDDDGDDGDDGDYVGGDDAFEEGPEETPISADERSRRKRISETFKKDWESAQYTQEDEDEDDDADDDMRSPRCRKKKPSSEESSKKGAKSRGKGKQKKRRGPPPLEVSPLAKYLKWSKKDKKETYDLRRTLHLAHDILQKKAVQEVIESTCNLFLVTSHFLLIRQRCRIGFVCISLQGD